MEKKTASAIMLTLLLTSMVTLAFNIQPVKATGTIYIRADGSIDPPDSPLSTVDNATYTLTSNVTSDADGIVVKRDNVVIDGAGYTVQGAGSEIGIDLSNRMNVTVKNTRVTEFETGILLASSSRNTLLNNTVVDNSMGIKFLELSDNNMLSGTSISSNYEGVRVYRSRNNTFSGNTLGNNQQWAILIEESNYNILLDNIVTNNNGHGVYLWGSLGNSLSNNTVTNNYGHGIFVQGSFRNTISLNKVIYNHQYGIFLRSNIYWGSTNNTIFRNNVTNNGGGIHIYEENWGLPASWDNIIYHNNFVDNIVQVRVQYRNTWDDDYPSGGNCWSDYTDVDLYSGPYQNETGSDDIWDHPYVIDENNQDRYPIVVNPWTPTPRPPWDDDNGNGILNYLDIAAFKTTPLVRDIKIPLTIRPGIQVGEIDWPVSIDVVETGTSQTTMLNTLRSWGVPTADSYMYVYPLIFDIASVGNLVTTLKDRLHLPSQISDYMNNELCSDGHFRLLIFFGVKQFQPEFPDALSVLKAFKNLLSGNAEKTKESVSDLLWKIVELMDLGFYIVKDGVAPVLVKAAKILSVSEIVKSLKTLVDLLKDGVAAIVEVATALVAGTLNKPAVILALAKKTFTFVADFIVSYVPIPTQLKDAVKWVKGILELTDPPDARLDLQLYNSSSNELMLGYDSTADVNYTYSDFGFWFEDPDKQIFILSKDIGTCNITVACSGSNSSASLPYTFTLLDRAFNTTTVTGSFLSPGELTSATLTIGPDNRTAMDYLLPQIFFNDSHPRRGETVTAYINVTDGLGQIIPDSNATLLIGNSSIPLTSFANGTFLATIDTSQLDGPTLVYVYAKHPNYMYGKNVDVLDALVPDISVDAITTSKNVIGSGFTGNVNVTLNNHGNFTETFDITLYANSTIIITQTVTLTNGSSSTITFTWNTTGFAYGNYTIKAIADTVLGEIDTEDNTLIKGIVTVTISGDLNGDFKVSLADLVILAQAYGSKLGDSNWNPNADVDGNSVVGLSDLVILANHYGQQFP
jgi:parallel beta-helix repeat protein